MKNKYNLILREISFSRAMNLKRNETALMYHSETKQFVFAGFGKLFKINFSDVSDEFKSHWRLFLVVDSDISPVDPGKL